MNRFRRAAREAVLIILLGFAAGLAFNFPLLKKWAGGEFARAFISKDEYPGIRMISRAEAEDLFFGGGALFVDSRSRRDFKESHIPGALSLPYEEYGRGVPAETPGLSPGKPLVVYCEGGDCRASLGLAKTLARRGFGDIRVYEGGWEEWEKAGLPVENGDDQE